MNFLLLNQFFPPDDAPTGQLLADVARALAAEGHSVTVVCSGAAYAGGNGNCALPGVRIQRLKTAAFGRGNVARLVSYFSFYADATLRALFGPRPDVILTLTTPPVLSFAGSLAKIFRGARHFNWVMDVYPDVAVDLGVIRRGSIPDRLVGALSDFSRRRCDGVITLGPCMRRRLLARGVPAAQLSVAENWADGALVAPRPFPPDLPLTLLYSGNLGRAHDADTITDAMLSLGRSPRFRFVFAGGGPRRDRIAAACKAAGVTNAHFLPYQERRRLADHLGSCHIGLVTQRPSTCGSLVPSKIYALMAAGRPFIFVGPAEATPALNIERFACGWRVDPGDSVALTNLLESLSTRPDLIRVAGDRARQAFLAHYDVPQGVARILDNPGATAPQPAVEPCFSLPTPDSDR